MEGKFLSKIGSDRLTDGIEQKREWRDGRREIASNFHFEGNFSQVESRNRKLVHCMHEKDKDVVLGKKEGEGGEDDK